MKNASKTYSIHYKSAKGTHINIQTPNYNYLADKIQRLFNRKVEAVAKYGDLTVARVWKEANRWYYFIDFVD